MEENTKKSSGIITTMPNSTTSVSASAATTTSAPTAEVPRAVMDEDGADITNAGTVYHESGLDDTQDDLRSGELKQGNRHAASSLVARMLWGHEENVNLNVRVSEDGVLDLNDDAR